MELRQIHLGLDCRSSGHHRPCSWTRRLEWPRYGTLFYWRPWTWVVLPSWTCLFFFLSNANLNLLILTIVFRHFCRLWTHCSIITKPDLLMNLHVEFISLACNWELWPESRPAGVSDGVMGHHGISSAHVQWSQRHLSSLQGAPAEQTHHRHQPRFNGQAGISHCQGGCATQYELLLQWQLRVFMVACRCCLEMLHGLWSAWQALYSINYKWSVWVMADEGINQ